MGVTNKNLDETNKNLDVTNNNLPDKNKMGLFLELYKIVQNDDFKQENILNFNEN